MAIKELFAQHKKTFSFEFFPPKDAAGEALLYQTINDLRALHPSFVSVTYGAMGTNQDGTLFFVKKIKQELGVEVMAHFTCVCADKERVRSFLAELEAAGIYNILALRGDIPDDVDRTQVIAGDFRYASDLIAAIREHSNAFTIMAAGYPECHPEAPSLDADIDALKRKIDAGAQAVITQLFFMNDVFYRYCDRVRARGITVPIIPGIMPVQSARQLEIFSSKCGGISIPPEIKNFFTAKERTKEEALQFGIDFATAQCRDLLRHDVPGIHFYTLNRSRATRLIFEQLNK